MHTENTIWIAAPPERVFALAQDIARWPNLLPHYRWVRVFEEKPDSRLAEMAARRGPFPVKWRTQQGLIPAEGRITYRHVGGITRGMEVEWLLGPERGGTRVLITHDLRSGSRLLRLRVAEWVIGGFVSPIADRTLQGIKRAAEGGAR